MYTISASRSSLRHSKHTPWTFSLSSDRSPFFHHASRRFHLDSRPFLSLTHPCVALATSCIRFFYPGCSPSSGILSIFGGGMMLESSQFKKRVCLRSRMLQIRLKWISPVMITTSISINDRLILDPPDRRVTNRIRDSPFAIYKGRSCSLGDSNVSSAQDTCFALGL